MILSKNDKTAQQENTIRITGIDVMSPFGNGIQPMPGGGHSGAPQTHTGAPPSPTNDSAVRIQCPNCDFVALTWTDFRDHSRSVHNVRDAATHDTDDLVQTYAALFIDAIGKTLPFKETFSFHELHAFCRREGMQLLSLDHLPADTYERIAQRVADITNNAINITPQYTKSESLRHPISAIDLLSERSAFVNTQHKKTEQHGIRLFAHVKLSTGDIVDVVEIDNHRYIGVDDQFQFHTFGMGDVLAYENIDDRLSCDMPKTAICQLCGHVTSPPDTQCQYCGEQQAH